MSDSKELAEWLTDIALQLKSGQAFMYDPDDSTLALSVNISVSGQADELRRIIDSRQSNEVLAIHRAADKFTITFVSSARL